MEESSMALKISRMQRISIHTYPEVTDYMVLQSGEREECCLPQRVCQKVIPVNKDSNTSKWYGESARFVLPLGLVRRTLFCGGMRFLNSGKVATAEDIPTYPCGSLRIDDC